MRFIFLTCIAYQEGDYYVSKCEDLGVASFGDTPEQAFDNLDEAVLLFLNTLEDLGECDKVLMEKNIQAYEAGDKVLSTPVHCGHNELAQAKLFPIPAVA